MKPLLRSSPLVVLIVLLLAEPCRAQRPASPLRPWLEAHAITSAAGHLDAARIAALVADHRVIGLGEATHGQHEAFDLKRRVTLELVRNHQVRTVAYEASASLARACNAYIHGRTNELRHGMNGLSMLIWDVEENAALLEDLRAWNAANPNDPVRFIGVDAQDGDAVVARLSELLSGPALRERAATLVERATPAIQLLFQGDRSAFEVLRADLERWELDLQNTPVEQQQRDELRLRSLELRSFITMYASPGGRDAAMAELLLAQLDPTEKCVVWAHNAHVKRSALDYLGSDALAMGGHLSNALGRNYYALGFAFGSGGFQANVPDSTGRWSFKRYHHSAPATGSLEADLAATELGDIAFDLHRAAQDSSLQRWTNSPHGHRWWGGYNVPDDCEDRAREASQLLPMTPAKDFDGLVFLLRTTAAVPMDRTRILPAPQH